MVNLNYNSIQTLSDTKFNIEIDRRGDDRFGDDQDIL